MSSAKAASDIQSCAALNTVLFAAYSIVPRDVTDPSSEQLRRLLDYVQTLKSAANSTFKSGSYGDAFTAYNVAYQALHVPSDSAVRERGMQRDFAAMEVALLTNQAQAKLSLWNILAAAGPTLSQPEAGPITEQDRDMEIIINTCGQALRSSLLMTAPPSDPLSAKAFLRRALAWRALGYPGMWRHDLESARMLDPSNQQLCTLAADAGAALGWRAGTGSAYDEWELWHKDPSPVTQRQLDMLTAFVQSRPEGIRVQMPPPRSDAKPLSDVLRRTMQGLSTVGPAPLTGNEKEGSNQHSRSELTDDFASVPVHFPAVGPLHANAGVESYAEPARFGRRDHYAAFRWLQRLDAGGYDLCPAGYYYLGRAFLHAECGAELNLKQAEVYLMRAVEGSHNHTICTGKMINGQLVGKSPLWVHDSDGTDCLVGQQAHWSIALKAVELLLIIYGGSYLWERQNDRARMILRRAAYAPNAHPAAQFNYALNYRFGRFSVKHFVKARRLYQKAAAHPHPSGQICPDAIAELAKFTMSGLGGLAKDLVEAKRLAELALEIGEQNVGSLYSERRLLCHSVLLEISMTSQQGELWEQVREQASGSAVFRDAHSAWDPTHDLHTCERPDCPLKETQPCEFKLCARCKDIKYCGQACQKLDWKRHKVACCPREADPDVVQYILEVPVEEEQRVCNSCKSRTVKEGFTANQWRGNRRKRRCRQCQQTGTFPEEEDESEDMRKAMEELANERTAEERAHAEQIAARLNVNELKDAIECSMCFEEIAPNDRHTLPCSHWGCRPCLRQHVHIQPTCHICRAHIDFTTAAALMD